MKKITAGVIGCGNIARFHISGLTKAGAALRWVCDVRKDARAPWAGPGRARGTADYREVLADPAVNTVVITTPSATHREIGLAAIEAGKAVVCEKTLATRSEDALEIVRAAEARKTNLYTCYMKRFIPAVEQARALLPKLGRILTTHIRTHQCWSNLWGPNPEEGFFHTPPGGTSDITRNYGGGILVCGGSHLLDLVCFLLGRPRRLYASVHTPAGRDYDLRAAALLETARGVVHFEALAHSLTRIGFLRDGWDERIEITGTRGRLELFSALWDQPEHKASRLLHTDARSGRTVEYSFAPESPFDRAWAFFHPHLAAGRQGPQSRWTGYVVDSLIEAIQQSSATGSAVEPDWPTEMDV